MWSLGRHETEAGVPSTAGPCPSISLDLATIEAALRGVQAEWPRLNGTLAVRREPLDDETLQNLLSGYALVGQLLARPVDLFALGGSAYILELNTRVLCGTEPLRRQEYRTHIAATHRNFYERTDAGIQALAEWYGLHRDEPIWRRAAGLHIQVVSQPQLFIEGNDRTGALLVSYLLAREGRRPFVVNTGNAKTFLDLSAEAKLMPKTPLSSLFRSPRLKARMAVFFQRQAQCGGLP